MIITVMKLIKVLLALVVAATFSSCAGMYGGPYASYGGGGYGPVGPSGGPIPPPPQSTGQAYVVGNTPYVTSYGPSSRPIYMPPTQPMNTAPSNVRASYRGRLYDSYGFLQNGAYYQTQAQQGATVQDYIQTQLQWPQ